MYKRPIISCVFKTIKSNILLTVFLLISIVGSVLLSVLPALELEKIVYSLTDLGEINIYHGLIYFALIAVGGFCDALRSALILSFGQKTTANLRMLMMKKLSSLPAGYFINNESGKTLSRFIGDIDAIDTLFKSGVISMVVDLFKIIFILATVFTKSLGLGVLLVVATPIVFSVSWHFKNRMHKAQMDNRRAIGKINNHIPETVQNARTIRTLKKENYMKNRFRRYVNESFDAFERTYFYEAVYTPIINEISVIIIAILMTFSALGGAFQNFFGMHVSTAVAVIGLVSKIFSPIENLGMEIQNVQSALAGCKRVNEFFSESEKKEQTFTDFSRFDFSKPAIEFSDVTFSYGEKVVLDKVTFSVKTGESVALVGRTGAGKTTVYRLILGLFTQNEGSVKIFGEDADQISDDLKRLLFGYVEQGIRLVSGTVKDQISLGDDSISDSDIINALEMVGLYETVTNFDNGINTECHEGLFSQGQLQLLSVARAIVKNPKILLLDEITANLDSETEREITDAIKKASKMRTVINISHRLGDIREDTKIIDITKLKRGG